MTNYNQVSATVSAQSTWSSPLSVCRTYYDISVSGTFTATVSVQRSFDGGTTWRTVTTYTSAKEDTALEPCNVLVRIGVDTGNYSNGSAVVLLQCDGRNWGGNG